MGTDDESVQGDVLAADVEAAEGYVAVGLRGVWALGSGLGALMLGGAILACRASVVLVPGLLATALGGIAGARVGWWLAERVARSVLSRRGSIAAYAASFRWWQRGTRKWWQAEAQTHPNLLKISLQLLGSPMEDEIPPGMTRDEFVRGWREAREWIIVWGGLACIAGLGVPMAAGLGLGLWMDRGAILPGIPLLWAGTVMLISLCVGLPAGWEASWRRQRDTVARRTGAISMDEFMAARGYARHPWSVWRRAKQSGTGTKDHEPQRRR